MLNAIPETMTAVLLTGHGGFDKLSYRTDVPVPALNKWEVLIRVGAAGINNTDINTRIGWYSKRVTGGTHQGDVDDFENSDHTDAGWTGKPLVFPRIQGADCCGRIVRVGDGVDPSRIGERVIVRNMLRGYVGHRPFECWTLGSEVDGAFAQYVKVPALDTYAVRCDWSGADLASIPCAYSTAENLLHRASVSRGDRVLITGASGGVGSAAIQLAKCKGADVWAVAGKDKAASVFALGAEKVVYRGENLREAVGKNAIDVVIDLVGGPRWPELLDALKIGGRFACAGAIAGPLVELDLRNLYLKDLTFFGCTFQEDTVFENLIRYIEQGEIKPVVARVYPLKEIVAAQKHFLTKTFTGKLVLEPPSK